MAEHGVWCGNTLGRALCETGLEGAEETGFMKGSQAGIVSFRCGEISVGSPPMGPGHCWEQAFQCGNKSWLALEV